MEQEMIYLVGSKQKDGNYNKLVKCFEQFWFNEKDAVKFLKNQPKDLQQFYAVFEVLINIDEVEKILDGKNL